MDTRKLFDDLNHALNSLGFHVTASQLDMNARDGSYRLTLDAVAFTPGRAVASVRPAVPKVPTCECGAAAAKTTHSSWCPLTAKAKP